MSEAARRRRPRKVVRRDPALEDEILELIASGRSVRDVLSPARPAHLPSRAAFMAWVAESARAGCGEDDLADRYFQARQLRAGVLAEECLDIADGRLPITYAVPKGSEMEVSYVDDHACVARDKLRVDTRKWFCAKLFGCSADLLGPDCDRGTREETTFADLAKLAEEAATEDE